MGVGVINSYTFFKGFEKGSRFQFDGSERPSLMIQKGVVN